MPIVISLFQLHTLHPQSKLYIRTLYKTKFKVTETELLRGETLTKNMYATYVYTECPYVVRLKQCVLNSSLDYF